jgi:hypothetical protein
MGFHYIHKTAGMDYSLVGILLLNEATYDCDVEIYGKSSPGCNMVLGSAGELPCEFEGYGHSKRIKMLWNEAIPSGSTAEEIGEYTVAQSSTGKGIARIKKGQSYYLITNETMINESQRNIIAPAQVNFNPKDYDFNIGNERHINTSGKCDYGWEYNYECQSSYGWNDWKAESKDEVINEKTNEAVIDSINNETVPQWTQFSKEYDNWFKKNFYVDENHDYGMLEWSSANYESYSYFIDCNPKSACYLKAFAVDSCEGEIHPGENPMRIFNFKRGYVKPETKDESHFLSGGEFPGSISGVKDGIATVMVEPYCKDQDVIKQDGQSITTKQSTFLMDEYSTWFEKIEGNDLEMGTDDAFEEFCFLFRDYIDAPPLEYGLGSSSHSADSSAGGGGGGGAG